MVPDHGAVFVLRGNSEKKRFYIQVTMFVSDPDGLGPAVVIKKHFIAGVPGFLVYGILKVFSYCFGGSPFRDVVRAYA